MNLPSSHLIVCERTSAWAVAWRRALGGRLRVVETRTVADCERELASFSASLVALEISAERVAETGPLLARWRERHPHCVVLALGGPTLAPWELYLREAGALDVLCSRRAIPRAARLAVRYARRFPAPPPAWKQTLWAKLPWSDTAPILHS